MRRPTEKQVNAVHFCEEWLHVSFEGDIDNIFEVCDFLQEYLEEAKMTYLEIKCEYEVYLWDLD